MKSDTAPDIEQLQIERLRAATPSARLQTAVAQSRMVIQLAKQALVRAHPNWPQQQIEREYVRLHYGEKLARLLDQTETSGQ